MDTELIGILIEVLLKAVSDISYGQKVLADSFLSILL